MLVRLAEVSDVPWLLAELREFAAYHPLGPVVMGTDTHVEALLADLMEHHLLAVADHGGTPIGFIAGAVVPHPFNPSVRIATELAWWVTPPSRGSRAGLALLNAFDAWASEYADVRQMTLEAGSPVNPDTLLRRGYQLAETNYIAGGVA